MLTIYEKIENLTRNTNNNSYRIIGLELLNDFNRPKFKTQKELSEVCFVSISTITQFAKSISLSGYRELIVRLTVEKERYVSNQNINNDFDNNFEDLITLKKIYKWLQQNNVWINKISEQINAAQRITIFSSFQARPVTDFLAFQLQSRMIDVRVINIDIDILNSTNLVGQDDLKLAIVTGRDISSLIDVYLVNAMNVNSTNNFCITSLSQKQKVEKLKINHELVIDIQSEGKDFSYAQRYLALVSLFTTMISKIPHTKKYSSI